MEHPRDVGVHECRAPLVGKRRDSARRIRADSGKRTEPFRIVRNGSPVANDVASEGVEVPRASVVSQSRPRLQHAPPRRFGDVIERGEASEKALVIIHDARHLRLLQHELGHEDAVWITRAPPRQIASVIPEPRAKTPRELAASCGIDLDG